MPEAHSAKQGVVAAAVGVVLALLATVLQASPAGAIAEPSALTPSGDTVAGIPILTWGRVAGATGYNVQVSTDSDFGTKLDSASTTNRRYVPPRNLPAGTIWWRVQSKGSTGLSGWATTSFSNRAHPGPTLTAPTDGTPLQQPHQPTLLSWAPVPGAASYSIEVDDSPGFPNPNITVTGVQTTSYVLQNSLVPAPYYWHVKAVFEGGTISNWSEERSFTIVGLAAPTLVRPADDPTNGIQDVVLEWNPVLGATRYELEVSVADSFNTTRERRSDIVGTTFTPTKSYWNDQYFWHVRAIDANGNKSPWGPTWRFKRDWPDQPVRQYPEDGSTVGKPFFFQWTGVPHASTYKVLWKPVADAAWKECPLTVHTTQAPSVDHACGPTTSGDYEWRVVFWDNPGPASREIYPGGAIPGEAFLASNEFHYDPSITEAATPGPVVSGLRAAITGTASQTPGQYCQVAAHGKCENMKQTPVLRWAPVTGATKYELIIANDAALTNTVEVVEVPGPMYTRLATLPENQATDGYYWQVQACLPGCPHAFDSDEHRVINKKSNLAELTSPENGDLIGADVVRFEWKDWLETNLSNSNTPQVHTDSTGVNSQLEARQYYFAVSTVPNFQTIVWDEIVDEVEYSLPLELLPEGVLYWRVIPIDGTNRLLSDSGPYAAGKPDVRTFTKRTSAPTLKQLNGGLPLPQTMALQWNPLQFASTYNVEVYKNNDIVGQPVNRVANITGSKQIAVSLNGTLPATNVPYRWRVQKVDASGNKGPWSDLNGPNSAFTITGSAPAQTAPSNGARVANNDAYFAWTGVSGAKNYRFELRRSGTSSLTATSTTAALAWAHTSNIADGSWLWRVVALDTGGDEIGASGWLGFTVDGTPPTVKSVTPKNKSIAKRTTNFTATFSEPVTNVTKTTVRLYLKGSSKPVKGKVTLDASKTKMKFNPTKNLKRGKKYTLKIFSGVTDASGLALAPYKWKITVKK